MKVFIYLVAACSASDSVCNILSYKGSRNEHYWICLVKLEAEKKI